MDLLGKVRAEEVVTKAKNSAAAKAQADAAGILSDGERGERSAKRGWRRYDPEAVARATRLYEKIHAPEVRAEVGRAAYVAEVMDCALVNGGPTRGSKSGGGGGKPSVGAKGDGGVGAAVVGAPGTTCG